MRFSELATHLEKLEETASRNEITKILAEVLKKSDEEEVDKICYLALGELLPAYRGVEFNIAEKIMMEVLARSFRKTPDEISRAYKSKGDLGNVAHDLARGRVKKHPDVKSVYQDLLKIANYSGTGSQEEKISAFSDLISGLDALSAKFISRIPLGKLRLGFSDATLLDALSVMEKGDKSARPEIERAYNVTADIGEIARRVKKSGLGSLKKVEPEPGIPIRPSLAERLKSIDEILEKAGPVVGVEQKLDGFRTQVHIRNKNGKKDVTLFSRNLENTTTMFPEIVASARNLPVQDAILDGETIGYNPQTEKFSQFQETVQRKRKYDIAEFAKKIPLSIFVFDVLHLDGKSLLGLSFKERREELEKIFKNKGVVGSIRLSPHQETDDPKTIASSLKESTAKGLEGLVLKKLDAAYQAGSRGFHWIKLKSTSAALEKLRGGTEKKSKLPDTIDGVLMGAYKGRGKRTKFGVGGFLLGVRGPQDRYYTISRLGTGLSDEQFREARRRIKNLEAGAKPKEYEVDKDASPDIWIKPQIVVEILADEITLSPRHTAGRGVGGKRGYSLRFPRLVRFRDDKNAEDATTAGEIEIMYKKQK